MGLPGRKLGGLPPNVNRHRTRKAAIAGVWRLVSALGLIGPKVSSDGGSGRLRGRDGVRAGPVKGLETEKLALPFDQHVVTL